MQIQSVMEGTVGVLSSNWLQNIYPDQVRTGHVKDINVQTAWQYQTPLRWEDNLREETGYYPQGDPNTGGCVSGAVKQTLAAPRVLWVSHSHLLFDHLLQIKETPFSHWRHSTLPKHSQSSIQSEVWHVIFSPEPRANFLKQSSTTVSPISPHPHSFPPRQ